MTHTTATTRHRARKARPCTLCCEPIEAAAAYARWAGTTDGHWWTVEAHPCCAAISEDRTRKPARLRSVTPHSVPGGPMPHPLDGRTYYEDSVHDAITDGYGGWHDEHPVRWLVGEEPGLVADAIDRLAGDLRDEAERVLRPLVEAR